MREFLPATGRLVHMHTPDKDGFESGVRADYGIRSGDAISTFYDPMIAKLIAYDDTREGAVSKLERALRGFQVAGLVNNIDFLVDCARHPGFSQKQATTAFFSEHLDHLLTHLAAKSGLRHHAGDLTDHSALAITALTLYSLTSDNSSQPWSSAGADWRPFGTVKRPLKILPGGSAIYTPAASSAAKPLSQQHHKAGSDAASSEDAVTVESVGANQFVIHTNHVQNQQYQQAPINVKVKSSTKVPNAKALHGESVSHLRVEINGCLRTGTVAIHVNAAGATVADVWLDGQTGDAPTHTQVVVPPVSRAAGKSSSGRPVVLSPMPGRIVKLISAADNSVKAGATLIVLEAMKMEHIVVSPSDGNVTFFCAEGATVSEGEKLAEVAVDATKK